MTTTTFPAGAAEVAEPVDYAQYGRRVKAAVIDSLLIWLVFVVLYFAFGVLVFRGGPAQDAARVVLLLLGYFGPTLYYIVAIAEGGQTVGKMMSDIAVRRDGNEDDSVGYFRAFLRAVIPPFLWLLLVPGLLDVLWPLWDEKRQTLHDKIAGTVVVEA